MNVIVRGKTWQHWEYMAIHYQRLRSQRICPTDEKIALLKIFFDEVVPSVLLYIHAIHFIPEGVTEAPKRPRFTNII
jgi:hypothetical protein